MALPIEGKIANVKGSIEKYIYDKLVTIESLTVNFQDLPFESGSTTIKEWVQEWIIGKGASDYHRQVDSTNKGQTSQILLSFNIFVKKELTTKTNREFEIRDIVANHFRSGVTISLYDHAGGDYSTVQQWMPIREVVTDQPIPDDDFYQYNYTVEIDWLEKY